MRADQSLMLITGQTRTNSHQLLSSKFEPVHSSNSMRVDELSCSFDLTLRRLDILSEIFDNRLRVFKVLIETKFYKLALVCDEHISRISVYFQQIFV
jgi:hypothetical protein